MIPGRSTGRAARKRHAVIGFPGGHSDTQALFTRLTLYFAPEPGLLLLLGPGVVVLALLGRRRMRSWERDPRMGSRDAASESKGFAR